jgi:hypothetical protein
LARRSSRVLLPLVLGGFQFCGLEAAIREELFFGSRRDVPVNLTRIKEFKPHFKSDSGSS